MQNCIYRYACVQRTFLHEYKYMTFVNLFKSFSCIIQWQIKKYIYIQLNMSEVMLQLLRARLLLTDMCTHL